MPIPTFDQLLRPILELSTREDVTRKSAAVSMIEEFSLSEEQAEQRIPSGGSTFIGNRAGWAMSHLTKGGLIEKVAKYTYRATQKGREYLETHEGPITPKDLREIEGLIEAWQAASKRKAEERAKDDSATTPPLDPNTTPEELIDQAVLALDESLRAEILEHLAEINPYRFEQVVIDVLFAMGYGGSREEAAHVTKKSNDEGIDGIISEDRLGLDVIYVQAKRWQNTVGRKEIQSFVGALAGKQAHKGVFITTSGFANTATDYAATVTQKIVLIDGLRLADLMIEHGVGVSTTRTISIKRIDSDYFEES